MRKRSKVAPRQSKKLFSKTAKRTNKKNTRDKPMRGGIRL